MKINIIVFLTFLSISLSHAAEVDSMFIHYTASDGADSILVLKLSVIDSIVYYAPNDYYTGSSGKFTDRRDNNEYNWIKIGEKIWMAENLAYLPQVDIDSTFYNTKDARYSVYGYNSGIVAEAKVSFNYNNYGVLYNWYAAMAGDGSSDGNPSGVQGVCPTGWHLPSINEWAALEATLTGENKGSQIAGNKDLWTEGLLVEEPKFGSSGFTGLPGGYINTIGGPLFYGLNYYGLWWSSTENVTNNAASFRYLQIDYTSFRTYEQEKTLGCSVRCIKDF